MIPFIGWLVSGKQETFFHYLGLKALPNITKKLLLFSLIAWLGFLALGFSTRHYFTGIELANSHFTTFDLQTGIEILIYSFIKTALAEEIFFRGFLLKRFQHRFGFTIGNVIQASLFGGIHVLLLLTQTTSPLLLFIFLFTGMIGMVLGWLNEKLAGGSLLPSWLIHGLSNVSSSLLL